MGICDRFAWRWIFSWKRALRPREIVEKAHLTQLLSEVTLDLSSDDVLIWTPNKSGAFSVKSATFELAKSSPHTSPDAIRGLWKGLIPYRVEIFVWLAIMGKIHSKARLTSIGIIPISEALVCFATLTWRRMTICSYHAASLGNFGVGGSTYGTFNGRLPPLSMMLFYQWHFEGYGPFFKKVWFASFFIIIWSLWKERNAGVFGNVSPLLLKSKR